MGSTYAYIIWRSTEEQKTNVVFSIEGTFSCAADIGGNITSDDVKLKPTTVSDKTTGNYIKREVKVRPVVLISGKIINMDLWLDINELGSGLSNSVNFKYVLTTSSTSNTEGVVVSGNFNGKKAGDKIILLDKKSYSSKSEETYYLWIWLDSAETNLSTASQTFDLSINGVCAEEDIFGLPASQRLIKNANPSTLMYGDATNDQKKEMWTFTHEATEQTEATTDYRYIGSNPNNYINFNDEVWRIIGVFDGNIKIVKDTSIGDMPFDYKGDSGDINDDRSSDWTDAQLMYMLNPTSYKLKEGYVLDENYIRNADGNIIYQLGCIPSPISIGSETYDCTPNTWNLNETALSQISEETYYLGDIKWSEIIHYGNAEQVYSYERKNGRLDNNSANWSGLVGLIYLSDYVYTYANGVYDACYTDVSSCMNSDLSWLRSSGWLISTYAGNVAFGVISGQMHGAPVGSSNIGARPVVYLNSDIKLSGSGTVDNPYEIVIG